MNSKTVVLNGAKMNYDGRLDFSSLSDQVVVYDDTPQELILERVADCGIVVTKELPIGAELLARFPDSVGLLCEAGTGYNNIDLAALSERGIVCCNVPGYSTGAVCQHTFALLLMFLGKTDKYAASVAAGDWKLSKSFCYMPWAMSEVQGKTFGVYGYGGIGRAVAKVAAAFGMRVIVHTRSVPEDCPYELVEKSEIFQRSDFLSFHCPLTPQTAGIINADTLALMQGDAVIINTARGGLADESALAAALNGGRIGGACLDTLAREPMSADNPLYGARNCIITPHIAWAPSETRGRLVRIVAENLAAFISGRPQNVVNARAGV